VQTLKLAIHFRRPSSFGCQKLMSAAFLVTLLTASTAATDSPPKLNVSPNCEAAARGSAVAGRNTAACLSDENAALDVLKKNWAQYPSADKVQCVGTNRTGGPSSYVELLSCLEIMRDAKVIQKDELDDPLLNKKGELDTRALMPTYLNDENLYTGGGTKVHREHRRNHRGSESH
jgi:hypothetical protein